MIRFIGVLWLVLIGTALQAAAPQFASAASDAQGARAVLLVDASQSMSHKFATTTKFGSVQDAIAILLEEWESGDELGITVVGHRFRDDCEDVDRIVPLAPPDAARALRAMERLQPTGSSPLGVGLQRAAKELNATQAGSAVIVLSDGGDACTRNLCEEIAKIAKETPQLKVHVIGLGPMSAALEGLQCLAKTTNGVFLTAANPPTLQQALRQAMQEIHKDVPPGIYLSAIYSEAGKVIEEKIHWTVYSENSDGSRGKSVRYGDGASVRYVLAPGKYQVAAAFGAAKASKSIEVQEGQGARHVLDFNAGNLKLRAVHQAGGVPIPDNVSWSAQQNQQGKTTRVDSSHGARFDAILPAGKYSVTAELGAAKREIEVEVKAGEATEQLVDLQSGVVQLRAVVQEGGAPFDGNIEWSIFDATKTEAKRLASSHGARVSQVLPVGKYRIQAAYSAASGKLDVEVKAGTTQSLTLNFNAGAIELIALKQFGDPLLENVQWELYEAGATAQTSTKLVARFSGSRVNTLLPTGNYVIKGAWKDLSGDRALQVSLGARETVHVRLRPPED